MIRKPASCIGCDLYSHNRGFVPAEYHDQPILILGEAPGDKEAFSGKPFVGAAGYQLFGRTLKLLGLRRENFNISNVICCRPQNNWLSGAPWEHSSIAYCDPNLRQVIRTSRPKVIICAGNIASRKILGITGVADRRAPIRGYVFEADPYGHECFVIPTYHPSYIMRGNPNLTSVQLFDFQKALKMASTPIYQPPWHNFRIETIQFPSRTDILYFIRRAKIALTDPEIWMAADIETERSSSESEEDFDEIQDADIKRISFAFDGAYGITIPWTEEFLPLIQEILLLPFPYFVFWNHRFDVPRIQAKGLKIGGKIYDAMDSWHFLQSDLPKGLGFVSSFYTRFPEWKSRAEQEPEYYSCLDSMACIENTYSIRRLLRTEGRFERFLSHAVELQPLLWEMEKAGVLIDEDARQEFRTEISKELNEVDAQVQEVVPDEVKPRDYKKTRLVQIPCPRCLGTGFEPVIPALRAAKKKLADIPGMALEEFEEFKSSDSCSKCEGSGRVGKQLKSNDPDVEKFEDQLDGYQIVGGMWEKVLAFLPSSTQQVQAYMQFRGHPIPKHHKTKQPTTGEKEIQSLSKRYKKDKLYPLILKSRELSKLKTTYIDGKDYQPGPDGRIHTTFTHIPSTWRYASQQPNLQNIPKRKGYSKRLRKIFIASPGNVLCELDFSAIEAVLVGFYAQDEDYIKAAKLSVHAILASHVLMEQGTFQEPIDLSWPEDRIMEVVREIKSKYPKQYDDAKHAVHGSGYGVTAYKLHMDFPKSFPTIKAAEDIQNLFFNTIGKKIKSWQQEVLQEAHQKHYLESAFGYRHYFWDVLAWDRKTRNLEMSGDAKRVLAFLPQNTATGIMREALRRFAGYSVYRKGLRLQVHDSLVFELPDDARLEGRIAEIQGIMEKPIPELDGLSIGTEAEVGYSWGEMQEFRRKAA